MNLKPSLRTVISQSIRYETITIESKNLVWLIWTVSIIAFYYELDIMFVVASYIIVFQN